VCGGSATLDDCGICDGEKELVDECFYELDGEYIVNDDHWCTCELQCDICGVCGGDDTVAIDLQNNILDGICDCNNDPGGTAYVDACFACVGGNTGEPECECSGVIDDCGICGGPGLDSNDCCPDGLGINDEDPDCAGVCGGNAFFDDCNVCSGGESLHTENSDKDCNGDCFGVAYIDNCESCVGGETGEVTCGTCTHWYMDNFVCDLELDVEIDDKCCKADDNNNETRCKIKNGNNCNLNQCNIDYDNFNSEGEPFCNGIGGYTADSLSTICANSFIDEFQQPERHSLIKLFAHIVLKESAVYPPIPLQKGSPSELKLS
jgi:hypothetical protein